MICRYAFSVPSPRHIWRIHRQTNVENFHAIARWLHSSAQVHTVRDIASAVAHRRLLIIYFSFSLIFRDAISFVCVCTLASRPPLVHSARAFNQGINASATFALTHNRKLTRNIYIYIWYVLSSRFQQPATFQAYSQMLVRPSKIRSCSRLSQPSTILDAIALNTY